MHIYNLFYLLIVRVKEADESNAPVIDVDGSYTYQKQQQLNFACITVTTPHTPLPPMTG